MLKFLAKLWERGMDTYEEEGFDAYHEGYALIDNPYMEGSYACAEWYKGWKNAERKAVK